LARELLLSPLLEPINNKRSSKMSNTLDFSKAKALEIGKSDHCAIKEVHNENIFSFPEGINELTKMCR